MIIRGPIDQNFVAVMNATARDDRLSFRARGVLTYLLSLPPDGETTIVEVAKKGREGRDAVGAAMRELAECGYLRRVVTRTARGRLRTDTIVYGTPQAAEEAERAAGGLDDRDTDSQRPVRPGQTQESPGQTGNWNTGVRSTSLEKKKTNYRKRTTENEQPDSTTSSQKPQDPSTSGSNEQAELFGSSSSVPAIPAADENTAKRAKKGTRSTKRAREPKPETARAQLVLNHIWEARTALHGESPTASYQGVLQIVKRFLAAGWSEDDLTRAAINAPILTANAIELTHRKPQGSGDRTERNARSRQRVSAAWGAAVTENGAQGLSAQPAGRYALPGSPMAAPGSEKWAERPPEPPTRELNP